MTPCRPVLAFIAGCALSILLMGRDLNAQPVDAASHIQLGGSAGVVYFLPTFGASLSIPLRPPLTLEGAADYVPLTFDDDHAASFLFQAQLRHRLNRGRTWRMHATYGATLVGKYVHRRELRQPRPDGSVIVFPEYRRMQIERPAGVHAGFGAERSLSDRVVARWDVQVLVAVAEKAILVPRAVFGLAWQRGSHR
jgi:hypothetical protein